MHVVDASPSWTRTTLGRGGSFLGAGRFLAHLQRDTSPRRISMRRVPIAGMAATVIDPSPRHVVHGTIVAIHGVAPSGNQDARMLAVGRAAAGLGFRVVLPRIEPFVRCELAEGALDRVCEAITATALSRDLCPSGRVSVFSACVSASLALVAATRRAPAAVIEALLLVGPYADVDALLDHLMLGDDELVDDYGRVVMLHSWSRRVFGELEPDVARALWLRILDGHHQSIGTADERLPPFLAAHPATRRKLDRITTRAHREELVAGLRARSSHLLDAFSPIRHLDALRARDVVLVHGVDDPIVPSHESVRLAVELGRREDTRSRLCVTPLIGHGDRTPLRPHLVLELLSLLGAFAGFFRAASPAAPPPVARWFAEPALG